MKNKLLFCLFVSAGVQTMSTLSAQNCQAGFTFNSSSDPTVSFTNTCSGATIPYYSWNFGDGNYSSAPNPIHTYSFSGTYFVCLYYGDTLNPSCWDYFCDTVVINNAPPPPPQPCDSSFIAYPDTSGSGGVTFYSIGQNNVSCFWDFGDNSTGTGCYQVFHQYAQTGWYNVCLTVITSTGDTCTGCDSVYVFLCNTQASFTYNNTNDPTISFTAISNGFGMPSYSWNFGDGNFGAGVNTSHTFQYSGIYLVCLTVSDSLPPYCSTTYCDSITIINAPNQPCDSSFIAYPDTSGNGFVWFYSLGQNNTSCFWDFGDNTTGTGCYQVVHQYAQTGWYNVCLTVITSTGDTCTGCDSVYVLKIGTGIYEQTENIFGIKNYPNPFTHATTILYSLKEKSAINVSVYNHLGMKMADLENSNREAGMYRLEWNADNIPAGIYHLKLNDGRTIISRKLILIK